MSVGAGTSAQVPVALTVPLMVTVSLALPVPRIVTVPLALTVLLALTVPRIVTVPLALTVPLMLSVSATVLVPLTVPVPLSVPVYLHLFMRVHLTVTVSVIASVIVTVSKPPLWHLRSRPHQNAEPSYQRRRCKNSMLRSGSWSRQHCCRATLRTLRRAEAKHQRFDSRACPVYARGRNSRSFIGICMQAARWGIRDLGRH
ncbi:MAG TPA: hypothetical protein PLF40_21770 [Kofleriaceae bacterium]|nr:hypothetical protein [Kofleriaceae bacterium]